MKATARKQPAAMYSMNALARMLGRDRATISRAVAGLVPAEMDGKHALYGLEDVEKKLKDKPDKSLREEKLGEEIRKLRLRNDKDEGKVVLRVDIAARLRMALGRMRGVLEQRLVNELATAVAGLEPAQVRIKTKQIYDEAMKECELLHKEMA